MGLLDGKVAIVTGGGRGVGRGEALELAAQGAKIVVNDLGGSHIGEGADKTPADEVVDIIKQRGGEAETDRRPGLTGSCRIPSAVLRRRGCRRTVAPPLRGLSRPMMSQ